MPIVYMMAGNIGTGKSTTTNLLVDDNTLTISEDLLAPAMTDGRYDQGVWTHRHFRVYRKVKVAAVEAALQNDFDVIIDGTNISIEHRAKYIEVAKKNGATVICYAFLDSAFGIENRIRNHRGTSPEVWRRVHEELERKWEMPTRAEGIDKVVVIAKHPPIN